MPFKNHGRRYDLVVFGATGYTGALTAEHVATSFPTNLKWALAGRSADKLKKVAAQCKALSPDRIQPEIETCSLDDDELRSLAKNTYVLITTVGPYAQYGEPVFKACAEAGTHYTDCTGEVVWQLAMIKKYEAAAKRSGACLFPQSGIESAPPDLITWVLASMIRKQYSAQLGEVVVDLHELKSVPSGGTLATIIGLFENFPLREMAASMKPYALSPVPNPRPVAREPLSQSLLGFNYVRNLGLLTSSITSAVDAAVVYRTWGLFQQEPKRNDQFYGPNFKYREYTKTRNFITAVFNHYSIASFAILMMLPPVRALIKRLIYQPGQGPELEAAKKEYIEYQAVATPDSPGAKQQAWCKVSYTGSMYYLTAVLLGQLALSLLEDDTGLEGGVYTPACLGQGYVDRVHEHGVKFETKMIDL